jgi:histone deacetylase 1/2
MKRGKGYSINVPLRDGITDDAFHSIFKPVSCGPFRTFTDTSVGRWPLQLSGNFGW